MGIILCADMSKKGSMKERAMLVRELVFESLFKLLSMRFSEDRNCQGYGKMGTKNLGKGKWKLSTNIHKGKKKKTEQK